MTGRAVRLSWLLALAACNGDDGESAGALILPDLQTIVPASLYSPGSPEQVMFGFINQHRRDLGMGLLAQHTVLDVVAANHARYLDYSGTSVDIESGTENPASPYFTGVSEQSRCDWSGYAGTCSESGRWSQVSFIMQPSYYQGLTLLDQGVREIGLARHSSFLFTGMSNGLEIQLGLPSGVSPQRQGSGFLLVTQLWGAFHVQINAGETLRLDSFSVRDSSGALLSGHLLTSANDPAQRVPPHAALFVQDTTRVECDGRVYTVSLAGARSGEPFGLTRELAITPYPYCG